jgi:antitoxin component HigA of HigAB toxin-antitoxin module
MGVQILEIAGRKMAVLPMEDYELLVESAEDRDDIAAAVDAERRRDEGMEYLPATMVNRILDGENALRVWREYRGMTIARLAAESGYGYSMISKVEAGKRQGTVALWTAVATVLGVPAEDVMPTA